MATMHDDEAAQVLRGVRAYFDDPNRIDGEEVRIVWANVASDGAAVIPFRRREDGRVEGLHIDLERFASLFDPRDAATLAKVIASDEISDRSAGEKRPEDWADGLVDYPQEVLWRVL